MTCLINVDAYSIRMRFLIACISLIKVSSRMNDECILPTKFLSLARLLMMMMTQFKEMKMFCFSFPSDCVYEEEEEEERNV